MDLFYFKTKYVSGKSKENFSPAATVDEPTEKFTYGQYKLTQHIEDELLLLKLRDPG